MPKLFAVSIVLFLLLGAGYGAIQAARATPWDCSDWQAFAHADRPTAILESLAENRGKTLYCGIDQSDTFAKAETWAAGKDRNERDDTVYFGERGQFRGFIAAQEGWLTEGESGITGQSQAVIFEFPKETRRVKRDKRIKVGSGDVDTDTCMTDLQEGRRPGDLICSGWGGWSAWYNNWDHATPLRDARHSQSGIGGLSTDWEVDWRTQQVSRRTNGGLTVTPEAGTFANPSAAQWRAMAETAAEGACRARGARYVAGSADFGTGHSRDSGGSGRTVPSYTGMGLGWFMDRGLPDGGQATHRYRVRQSRTWTGTCIKRVRRNR